MIEIKNLHKKYDDITVVDDLSLNVGKGEVLGFLGPNLSLIHISEPTRPY